MNPKRIYRLYKEMGLQLRNKVPQRRVKAKLRDDRTIATMTNQVWAMDVVHDQLATGRKLRILTIVDTFSRFSPAVDPSFSYRGEDVVLALERVCRQVGYPQSIRVDQGSEFISRDLDLWGLPEGRHARLQAYAFNVTYKGRTGTIASAGARIANNTDLGSGAAGISTTPDWSSTPGTFPFSQTCVYGASGSTGYLGIAFGSVVAGASFDIESYSLWICRPYVGFLNQQLSAEIEFTTPATLAATKVLLQWGGTQENNRVSLRIASGGALALSVLRDNVEQGPLAMGTLTANTRYRVKFAAQNARLSASLDGAPIVTDTSATLPGLGLFWVGRSYTGEAFDGVIHSVDVWAEALSDAVLVSPLRQWSSGATVLAAATGASTAAAAWYNQLAATLGWTVVSKGVGGETAAAVEARFDAESEPAYRSWLTIFINRPNGLETFEQFMSPHERMTGKVSRAFFVPPLLNSTSGLPDTNAAVITAVQAGLLTARWTGRTLDAAGQSAFQTAMNDDATRVGGGDWAHFDDSGHDIVDATVGDGLMAAGLAA